MEWRRVKSEYFLKDKKEGLGGKRAIKGGGLKIGDKREKIDKFRPRVNLTNFQMEPVVGKKEVVQGRQIQKYD